MLGPLMIDIEGASLSNEDRELLCHPLVCGVILFSRNYEHPDQLRELCDEIHELRRPRLLIGVDQEGGRVQRFRDHFVALPALATIGAAYDANPDDALGFAADCAWVMAMELRAVGVDFSFAPVLDLQNSMSSVIGNRAFHPEPAVVARLAQAYVASLHATGMAAVGKHFPGHGGVAEDSHHELPVDERDFYDIDERDLRPFRALVGAGIDGLMMAHVRYSKVDPIAAGYSERWIRSTLREDMRFEGVVFSDDLSMAGAEFGSGYPERARRALEAGCDVLLVCNRRAAVVELVDNLDSKQQFPQIQARLMRMHGRGDVLSLNELRADARWQSVSERIEGLNVSPELALGDDNLLA